MWKLSSPPYEAHDELLERAFPEADRALTEADRATVLTKYAAYEALLGRPTPVLTAPEVPEELKNRMHDAYGLIQDGRRLSDVRAQIKHLAESCPYCGYGPIEDLDHLLQRAHFQIFSIFPLNLVPCCAACNRGKARNPIWEPEKQQIHVYLEDTSDFDFLRASVSLAPGTGALVANFYIHQSEGMSDELYARLSHHLIEFDLQARYQKQVNIYLGEQQGALVFIFDEHGGKGLKKLCISNAVALSKRFGTNDWRTALMRGLAECEEFYSGGFRNALGIT